ncbi:MAG TPA: molecular chaperone HtpG [Algoriphagus sp.]|jgi:molecular chaperone HtpG|uniref:molecular chaperone HtpG n=1 Tax=unclassified Algoriphagus TaxID=2641541 RepID=UPI000C3CE0F2|nr:MULTISPECIES: molecular chaperone HtpG [unclassified Algoriphagus]MAL15840.1 molecular chaperone HtpG [Algoriphagus sp.]QYH40877.1 molecular chaperone HtpG [Algoriphagus sp. NBT04N3]HAS58522.1 molecular chaperone HtpG [Algoriphagus sp.]HCB47013.1 molecular chaperone HtpG [Algoriphagus sp.]HCD87363.1 molecular chaperone HtpG [Algoriphagus sp.]|tara:strand:- start:2060 stop:3946 length:1887 start_codon:yes stop_codon:yes gene_type:complete
MQEKGTISIHTENIFPIIKKFLYSDHEIFLRELVSNAVDATQKIKRLATLGQYKGELGDITVEVSFDEKKKTITIADKGLGMTAEEIKKYINQIAFSGATEFVEKFKDAKDANEIIGKFGLGFYSAFMVAKKVEIHTLSYQEGAEPAIWTCDGSTEFEIKKGKRKDRGTEIVLHINEDSEEFLDKWKLQGILDKYCKFLPVPIKFGTKTESVEDGVDDKGEKKWKSVEVDNIINTTSPIWTKSPSDLKDEDYLAFYKELYPMSEDPLFWIHLNVDYPFNLTGVLYFPKVKNEFELQRNKIKLFSRQVFITDEVKDIVPEFLMLLHGVIDSPDIPLNVSRSFLQADGNVKKINNYITKKVADKLSELYKKDRKAYEAKWNDIGLFVKYGMISEDKFYEKGKEFTLLKNTKDEYYTLDEYTEKVKTIQKDKNEQTIFLYATDVDKQDSFIASANKKDYDVLVLDSPIDSHFIQHIETKLEKTQLKRVDADVVEKLIQKEDSYANLLTEDQSKQVKELFEKAIDNKSYTVEIEGLSPEEMPVTITMEEWMRRMKDMAQTGGGPMSFYGQMPDSYKVAINGNHPVVDKILKAEGEEAQLQLAKQAFDLAKLSQGLLTGKDLTAFVKRSVELI